MDFKQAWLDGADILGTAGSGIAYTRRDWLDLSTSDDSLTLSGNDGRRTSRTYARVRTVTIEWVVDRVDNDQEFESVRYLENIFSLDIGPFRTLSLIDIYDREWTLDVKVAEPLSILEWSESATGSHWRWRVRLESVGDPTYRSPTETTVEGTEATYGGAVFPLTFPLRYNRTQHVITVSGEGNTRLPVKFEINIPDAADRVFGQDLTSGDPNSWARLLMTRHDSALGGRGETGNIAGYYYPAGNPYQYLESAGGTAVRWISWKLDNAAGEIIASASITASAYDPLLRGMKMQWSTDNAVWQDLAFGGNGFRTDSWTFAPDSDIVYIRAYKDDTDAVFNIARLTGTYRVLPIASPLTIRNLTDGTRFALDVAGAFGDRFTVDSEAMRAYRNGVDITSSRVAGSVFPAVRGSARFAVYDRDGGLSQSDFSVRASIRNALL